MKQTEKELALAKKQNFLYDIEQKILSELTPLALELYEKALKDGDLFVAKDILLHSSKIADRHAKKEQQQEGMGLQLWLQLRKERQNEIGSIDVEVINAADEEKPSPPSLVDSNQYQPNELPEEIKANLGQPIGELDGKELKRFLLHKPRSSAASGGTINTGGIDANPD
jgi:hypothetical protein